MEYERPTASSIRADVILRLARMLELSGLSVDDAFKTAAFIILHRFDVGDLLSEYTHAEEQAE